MLFGKMLCSMSKILVSYLLLNFMNWKKELNKMSRKNLYELTRKRKIHHLKRKNHHLHYSPFDFEENNTFNSWGSPRRGFVNEYGEHTHFADPCVFLTMDIYESKTLQDAMESPNAQEWWKAAQAEYDSLIENKTWEVVPLPEGRQFHTNGFSK